MQAGMALSNANSAEHVTVGNLSAVVNSTGLSFASYRRFLPAWRGLDRRMRLAHKRSSAKRHEGHRPLCEALPDGHSYPASVRSGGVMSTAMSPALAPKARNDRTRRPMNTDSSAASTLATRLWHEPEEFCQLRFCKMFLLAQLAYTIGELSRRSTRAGSSGVRQRNPSAMPSLQRCSSSRRRLSAFIQMALLVPVVVGESALAGWYIRFDIAMTPRRLLIASVGSADFRVPPPLRYP